MGEQLATDVFGVVADHSNSRDLQINPDIPETLGATTSYPTSSLDRPNRLVISLLPYSFTLPTNTQPHRPDIRDTFIMHPGILSGDGVECFPIIMETACVRWPLPEHEMTVLDVVTNRLKLTENFIRHIEDINNWSVGSALISRFPALVDKVWVQDT